MSFRDGSAGGSHFPELEELRCYRLKSQQVRLSRSMLTPDETEYSLFIFQQLLLATSNPSFHSGQSPVVVFTPSPSVCSPPLLPFPGRRSLDRSPSSGKKNKFGHFLVVEQQGVNSIDIKNLGLVFWPVFRPILPVSICLPQPANLPIFNLTFRAHFRAIIYVN